MKWMPLLALAACASQNAAPPAPPPSTPSTGAPVAVAPTVAPVAVVPTGAPVSVVLVPDQSKRPSGDRPWGAPVPGDEADRRVMAALGAAGGGSGADSAFSS